MLAAIAVISLFEFRMGMTRFNSCFPDFSLSGHRMGDDISLGIRAHCRSYGHAILCGLIFVIAYRLQRWLEWSHSWELDFSAFTCPSIRASCCGWPFWEDR